MTSQNLIVLTLMTVFASGLLVLAALALGVLAAVLIRENRKLQNAGDVYQRMSGVATAVANLRKEHVALDELVSAWMNRQAVRSKRASKKTEERDQPINGELWFPSDVGDGDAG